MIIIKKPFHKAATEVLRFVQKAVSKDPARPSITGICLDGDKIAGTDGFRIHMAAMPACLATVEKEFLESDEGMDGKENVLVKPLRTISSSPQPEEFQVFPANFPTYAEIFPEIPAKFTIAVNPKMLKEAMDIPNDGCVILSFWKNTQPMMVQSTDSENEARALIMPMHSEGLTQMPEPYPPIIGE